MVSRKKNSLLKGSSPHTRDKFVNPHFSFNFLGIIPAYAGQIVQEATEDFLWQDHPRIRGTNLSYYIRSYDEWGSSPHTRDKSFSLFPPFWLLRIIPAYAGQISPYAAGQEKVRDHPRIRGTNILDLQDGTNFMGSSPHTRDKCDNLC